MTKKQKLVMAQSTQNQELLDALRKADALISQLATVILNPKIADYIPFGLEDRTKDWLRNGCATTLKRAEGGR